MTIGKYIACGTISAWHWLCRINFSIMRKIFLSLVTLVPSVFVCIAANTDKFDLCPIKRFIGINSPIEFAQRFQGDTITFSVPNSEDAYFETFRLLTPDTIWLKERPKNKLPQEHKHYKLVTNFSPVPGWGVNSHRQYTPGTALECNSFILRGAHTETVQYLGTFNFVLLEDVKSGAIIKWDYTKNENNGLVISSPSILRHLSLMKGLDILIEDNDSTFIPGQCNDVTFSIGVKPKVWNISLDADFSTDKGQRSSRNWNLKFFLKKDEEKLYRIINVNN